MNNQLDTRCGNCDVPLTVTAESAAHDNNLIDIVVNCELCGRTLNAFIRIDTMLILDEGKEQDK